MSDFSDLICIGEPMMELNRQKDGSAYLAGHGGDTSNAAIAAARQGARVGYLTARGAGCGRGWVRGAVAGGGDRYEPCHPE